MRIAVLFSAFFIGMSAGAVSVHSAYTAVSVSHVEAQGAVAYSDSDRRALRLVIRSEIRRARSR